MKTKRVIFTLVAVAVILSSCNKTDNILPVGEPPFKGVYNPAVQVQQINLTTQRVNLAGDTVTTSNALVMRWYWSVNRLLGINCSQIVGDTLYRYGRSFDYSKDNQLIRVGTDFHVGYNNNGHISVMYTEADGLNYVCSTRYNGGSYPDFLSFFVTSKSAQDKEYRLRWKDGNLVAVIPDNHDIDSATYTYDRMSNPFNGVFWPDQWQEDNFLMQAPFISRNNPETITLYKDGQVVARHVIRYEYIDTKPFRINFSLPSTDEDGNPVTTTYAYTLHYIE